MTPEAAALAEFNEHLDDGAFLRPAPLTLQYIETEFDSLVSRHSARDGYRTYDVIHVASARAMNCQRFLTFDKKAKRLAEIEGLKG